MAILVSRYAIFNNWDFNNVTGLSVYGITLPGNVDRALGIFNLARRDARKVSSAFYQQNTLQIDFYIVAPIKEQLEQSFDTLMQNVQGVEGTLVVPVSGANRQFTATYQKYIVNDAKGGYVDASIFFEASDSYGYDTTSQTIYNLTNQTASINNYPYTQAGTAYTQVPVIQIQLNTAPSGTQPASITVGNQGTGQAVTVTKTWSQFDLLVIDCKNKTVQVNGVDIVFTGAIPEFGLGSNTINVQDTFTTRNYRFIAQVQNRYI